MALSLQGWLNGLSSSGLVIFGCAIGLFCIYKSRKSEAKLLLYWGLASIFFGLSWLGDLIDFLTILLTGKNMVNAYGLHSLICFMWVPLYIIFAMYVCAELLTPKKKWYVIGVITILGIFFELFIFLDPIGSFTVVYPDKPGEDLINEGIAFGSPAFIFGSILIFFVVIFLNFGFLYKSIQSEGVIRKKFLLLFIGALFSSMAVLDALTTSGIARSIVRLLVISGWAINYFGLREEPEKKEKIKPEKEVHVEGDLFRIYQYKKEDITEEEVSISKEKKICLVCKGKVFGFNSFICKCDTIYCQKCARTLSDLENMCWVCGTPFDESKPVKPYKEEEKEKITIEGTTPKFKPKSTQKQLK